MTDKNFEIGQVIYILSEQAQTILPGLVVEECVVKKLSGNSVSWKIKVGGADKAKLFDSARIKGEIYGNLDEVRAVMTERLTKFVHDLTDQAEQRVEKWYGKEIADREKLNAPLSPSADSDDKIDPDLLLHSIESAAPAPKFTAEATRAAQPQSNLRNHLRNLATPPPEDDALAEDGAVFVVDANGMRVPVRMPKV